MIRVYLSVRIGILFVPYPLAYYVRVIFHIITPLNHVCDYATKEIWMSQATKVIIIFPAHLSDNRWLDSTSFPMFFLHKGECSRFPKKSWPFPVGS